MAANAYDGDIDDEVRAVLRQDGRMFRPLGNRFPEVAARERAYNEAAPVLRRAVVGARLARAVGVPPNFEAQDPRHNPLANPNGLGRYAQEVQAIQELAARRRQDVIERERRMRLDPLNMERLNRHDDLDSANVTQAESESESDASTVVVPFSDNEHYDTDNDARMDAAVLANVRPP